MDLIILILGLALLGFLVHLITTKIPMDPMFRMAILIIVVVVMDFMAQVQAHLMSHQYESLMKKANLKGLGRG